jgi:hypothetical protein
MPSYQYAPALMAVFAVYARGDLLGDTLNNIGAAFGTDNPSAGAYVDSDRVCLLQQQHICNDDRN